jgi:sigma-E factor negative regulatory protein RseA
MDDELEPTTLQASLDNLTSDRELRALWDRYHLIGDALRGEPLDRNVQGVADRVRDRLVEEPAVLVPSRRLLPRRWVLPAAGSALAASVALLALLAGPGLFGTTGEAPSFEASGGFQVAERASARRLYGDRDGTYWNLQRPEVESKLNSYLVNHQEYSPSAGMKGMLPYASFVSYDARR